MIDDIRDLFREEVALARAEIREEISGYTSAAIQMAVGAVVGLVAVLFLLTALALGTADLLDWPMWAGYLTMAMLLGVVSAVAIMMGRAKARRTPAVPQQTIETLQENKEWLKHRMTSEHR